MTTIPTRVAGDTGVLADQNALAAMYDNPAANWAQGNATYAPLTGAIGVPSAASALTAATADAATVRAQTARALQGFRAALANRHYSRCNIPIIGDSKIEGQGATVSDRTAVNRATAVLRQLLPTKGLTASGGRGFIPSVGTGENTYTFPAATAVTAHADHGACMNYVQISSTSDIVTLTLKGTSFDPMFVGYGGAGDYQWQLDGGSWTTVTAPQTFAEEFGTRITLGGTVDAAHTLVIKGTGTGGPVYFLGGVENNGDEAAGIQLHALGHFGWTAAQWRTNWALNGSPASGLNSIAALTPAAIALAFGTNEVQGSRTSAQFLTDLQGMIGDLRGVLTAPYPPIILIAGAAPSGYSAQWPAYVAAMYSVAAADSSVVVCDLGSRIRNYDDTPTFSVWADGQHYTDKGQALWGDAVAQYLAAA